MKLLLIINKNIWKIYSINTTKNAKINDLTEKYDFAKQIAESGIEFKDWFMTLGEKPPIIYINLGAARGFYNMGGQVVFMYMTCYEEYKPTVDGILSAFLWLWFSLPHLHRAMQIIPPVQFLNSSY